MANDLHLHVRFGGLAAAHVIVTVLSLFVPFLFLVGFPILFVVLRSFMKRNNIIDHPAYASKLSTYTALGWITWGFALFGHFFMVLNFQLLQSSLTLTCCVR